MYILDKYVPKNLSEFIDDKAVDFLEDWYLKGYKKPLLISGGTGIGKSTLVRIFAKQHNFNLYELTPSDKRTKDVLSRETSSVAVSGSIFGKQQLLFFDNIDVFLSDERRGFDTIVKIAKTAKNPVIFVVENEYANKQMQKIRELSIILKMKKPSFYKIYPILRAICEHENIFYEESALKMIAKDCDGDLRSAILDVDFLAPFGIKDSTISYRGKREKKQDVFKTILGLFKSRTLKDALKVKDKSDLSFDMLFNWVVQNVDLFYDKEKLKKAYELISMADLNRARIYVRQNWLFLKYFIILGIISPVVFDDKDHFTYKIAFPSFMRKMSKETSIYSKQKKASEILQIILKGSKRQITQNLEFYKLIFTDKKLFMNLYNHMSPEDVEFLADYFKLPKDYKLNMKKQDTPTKSNVKKIESQSQINKIEPLIAVDKNKQKDTNLKEIKKNNLKKEFIKEDVEKPKKQKSLFSFS